MSLKPKITSDELKNLLIALFDYSKTLNKDIKVPLSKMPLTTIYVDLDLEKRKVTLVSDFDGSTVILDSDSITEKVFCGTNIETDKIVSELSFRLSDLEYDKRIDFDIQFGANERSSTVEGLINYYMEEDNDWSNLQAEKIREKNSRYLKCLEQGRG